MSDENENESASPECPETVADAAVRMADQLLALAEAGDGRVDIALLCDSMDDAMVDSMSNTALPLTVPDCGSPRADVCAYLSVYYETCGREGVRLRLAELIADVLMSE